MKAKLQFALDRALDATKELVAMEIDHILAAFNQGSEAIKLPTEIAVNLTNEGLIKFGAKITYKKTREYSMEYDPDQESFDFGFPGSNFGKLDITSDKVDPMLDPDPDEEAETEKNTTGDPPEEIPPTTAAEDESESPALFS